MTTPSAGRGIALAVDAYLSDCARWRAILDPKYHPTEQGALKAVYHRPEQAQLIRARFRQLIARKRSVP